MAVNVKVAVRCRPLSSKEIANGYQSIVELEDNSRIIVKGLDSEPDGKTGDRRSFTRTYDFDVVFDPSATQEQVYQQVCEPIVASVLEGYNGTIFAYGQTGTGKTYTMEGASLKQGSAKVKERKSSESLVSGNLINNPVRRRQSTNLSKQGENSISYDNNAQQQAKNSDKKDDVSLGIIQRAAMQIFNHISEHQDVQYLVRVSYLEIYQEEIHDLLSRDKSVKLELHEKPEVGVFVKGLTSFVCKSIVEFERVMKVGNQNRRVGATDMNERSSRSHAIFMITVEQQSKATAFGSANDDRVKGLRNSIVTTRGDKSNKIVVTTDQKQQQQQQQQQQEAIIKMGKLNLIDLAGAERQRKTNSLGQRQRESVKINLSLSALGNVINSLMKINNNQPIEETRATASDNSTMIGNQSSCNNAHGKQHKNNLTRLSNNMSEQGAVIDTSCKTNSHSNGNSNVGNISAVANHIPYRDSKLTRLLQDSLGGNAKTLMIANIGPASYNYDETINTLNYASRARFIRNRPRLNEDPKDALLRELQREIDELRRKLAEINADNIEQNTPYTTLASANSIGRKQSLSMAQTKSGVSVAGASGAKRKSLDKPLRALSNVGGEQAKRGFNSSSSSMLVSGVNDQQLISQELINLKQKLSSLESKLLNRDRDNCSTIANYVDNNNTDNMKIDHGQVLQGYTREQELELEARRNELANQVDREQAIRDELERKEEVELLTKQSFSSIQQEVEAKKKLIRQILIKVKTMRDSMESSQNTHRLELDELDQLQYVLTKELKLKCLIMDNFIPNHHVNQLLPRIQYDEKSNNCKIRPIELALDMCKIETGNKDLNANKSDQIESVDNVNVNNNHYHDAVMSFEEFCKTVTSQSNQEPTMRPKSEFERIEETIFPANIRFKYENLIEHKLSFPFQVDAPIRTLMTTTTTTTATGDNQQQLIDDNCIQYNREQQQISQQSNEISSKLQNLIDEALNQREPDIVII